MTNDKTEDGNDRSRARTHRDGDRYIVVLDRGWICVGNLTEEEGVCRLSNCKNLRCWMRNGFGGATLDPKAAEVELDDCADVIYQRSAEVFRVPISEAWGE